jgi:hypothetical protein
MGGPGSGRRPGSGKASGGGKINNKERKMIKSQYSDKFMKMAHGNKKTVNSWLKKEYSKRGI